ncbi:YybS family protein [Solibacillus silvestris]|uniref:YybS family protein n=1 Tax=Solibacillus silvestris TaxID=76853 RepID=UPI003F80DAFA
MQNNQTRKLAHGAMMVALFTVLMAIVFYMPVVKIIAAIIAPLPIIWYSANYERKYSFLVAGIAVIVTFFIGGLLLIPASLIFAAAGLTIGDAIYHKKSKVFMFISTSISLLITFAIQYVIAVRLFEFDFIRNSLDLMKTGYLESIKMTEKLTGQATPKEALDNLNNMLNTLEMTIPAAVTLAMLTSALVLISVNLPILKRLKVDVPKFSKFSELRLPRSVLWYYLIVLSINIFIRPDPDSSLAIIMLNISMILWVLLTIQGISFIHYALDAFGYPKFIKVLSTFIAIPLYSFVILVGIIDLGFNARDYIQEKSQK